MKKLKLFMILVTLCVLLTSQFNLASAKGKGKKSDWLKYLDADISTFPYGVELHREDIAKDQLASIKIISKEYNKMKKKEKCNVFLLGLGQASYQDRKLFEKLKKDFSLKDVPTTKMKHKFFSFNKAKILTTKDYKSYEDLYKWKPKGKLTPYKVDENGIIYFVDESRNFGYEATYVPNEKTGKIEIKSFLSQFYPTTPYIFFAGYMGYPDIPEASPDYK